MTNLSSIAGGALWIAVATLLMLATLEPVSLKNGAAPPVTLASADGVALPTAA